MSIDLFRELLGKYSTLHKHKKIRVIFGTSENSDCVLQWWSMRKLIWKHNLITNTFVTKIILDIYI